MHRRGVLIWTLNLDLAVDRKLTGHQILTEHLTFPNHHSPETLRLCRMAVTRVRVPIHPHPYTPVPQIHTPTVVHMPHHTPEVHVPVYLRAGPCTSQRHPDIPPGDRL